MNGLNTSRVLVIDNDEAAGAALVRALALDGIGVTYIRGEQDELPPTPLRGIRLLALDMELVEGGLTGEEKARLSPLISVLRAVLAHDNGPCIAIAWTAHNDLVEAFRKMVSEQLPDLRPVVVIPLPKSSVYDSDSRTYDVVKIASSVRSILDGDPAFSVIMDWEQRAHDATTECTARLSEIVLEPPARQEAATALTAEADGTADWSQEMLAVLAVLCRASSGKHSVDQSSASDALAAALNSLYLDCLEQSQGRAEESTGCQKLAEAANGRLAMRNPLVIPQTGAINRMLLLAKVESGKCKQQPGNLYLEAGWDDPRKFPVRCVDIGYKSFVEEILDTSGRRDPVDQATLAKCIPVLAEVSPACDFAQKNPRYARLLMGILLPTNLGIPIKKHTQFLKQIGPFFLEHPHLAEPADYCLVLSARFILGMNGTDLDRDEEAFRLRKHVLTDIQSWAAAYAARPGYLSLG